MDTLRLKYTKEGYMSYLGHLELMKLFERIFRYNKLPLKYSEGFNPIPRLTFASPLSVGYSSKSEVMEVQLTEQISLDIIKNIQFPAGIKVLDARYTKSKTSLMAALEFAEYLIKLEFEQDISHLPVDAWIESFVNTSEIYYEKKTKKGINKSVNAMEQIKSLQLLNCADNTILLKAVLKSGSNGSLNPETLAELILAKTNIATKVSEILIERIAMYSVVEDHLVDLFDLVDEA